MPRPGRARRTPHRIALSIVALLVALLTVTSTGVTAAQASVAPRTQLHHVCSNFPASSPSTYRGGECADIDRFTNSVGQLAARGQGQAFCQRKSDAVIVRCQGILQSMIFKDTFTGETRQADFSCGSLGGGACPADRFINRTAGLLGYCGVNYTTYVETIVVLPDGRTYGTTNGQGTSTGGTIC